MACIRGCLNLLPVNIRATRNLSMSAMRRAQEALDKIKDNNPYFEKYADKISKLQKTSPEEFLDRVDKVVHPIKEGKSQARTYSELLNPKQSRKNEQVSEIPYKKLADIMKLELMEDKTAEEISKIWYEYHKTKDVLAATLTVNQFDTLMERAKQYPIFLLPLPRSEGFEFIMLQFAANAVHFTTLLAYQVHAENAPECLTLVHYTEMKDKGIILMRGEYDSKVLTGQEAQCLANELQMFYYKSDQSKIKLLETFNKKPDEFKHTDLIKEVENIQLA
ncbi:PREDICTED: ATP synthase mitochondrial F1 complex assembly factor 1 [Rhagoletis zephyria]|uniref:ATP synthase mitochondrial F1 complex assembly factor 1 n=2 Tax=Rhagoletis zephyria TaxID=28612 RepID=UPI00081180F1|nr:PREDICTED: ATP synthase mitochondrial F1 complex assembly factor 1 [Rhagoletis zephyria]XP_017471979.1 PREDICTED: ATP synthase mitochondrial F1 complex assembly factor 1 [Rhagoletis zephyria]